MPSQPLRLHMGVVTFTSVGKKEGKEKRVSRLLIIQLVTFKLQSPLTSFDLKIKTDKIKSDWLKQMFFYY